MKKVAIAAILAFCTAAAACGGSDVEHESEIQGNGTPVQPTPTPEPTPEPTPQTYDMRITFTNIHVYENGESFGNGELYFTFAVGDAVSYSTQISAADNSDYNPASFGVVPFDITVREGEAIYIYANAYDDDSPAANDPMGTVDTGWYAAEDIIGSHSASGQDPYRYDVTYTIDWR